MKEPSLSVICASFNSGKTIEQTLNSILSQTDQNFEFIVIDNNSEDGTKEILKAYQTNFENSLIDYKWLSEADNGVYEAWNKGLRMAKGNWISFIGSDDCYNPEAIFSYSKKIRFLGEKKPDIIYSNVEVVDNENVRKIIEGEWKWSVFKRYMNIAHVGSFHNRTYFKQYGLFDESYKICGDYELLLRKKNRLNTLHIPIVLAQMGSQGLSNNRVFEVFKESWKAKKTTAGINDLLCFYDFCISLAKFQFRAITQ
ncbi:glycosyltransferase family 2 protein [Aegicerativicinus sediminis]|uniref:glycosyltransferase family 2 protein n=1 Tax=Aegicerativicinus sediminis TaxID=2893202 RepID=UPI001E2846DC|nr:glycosyltransferase family 2 protein [Aegicerativicinus sediminis]